MHIFGWCADGLHGDKCLKEYERVYFEFRKTKSKLVHTGEMVRCECSCHADPDVVGSKPKPKRKPRRKK